MKMKYLAIFILLLTILMACRSLQNGGGVDWATVDFSIGGSNRSSAQFSISGNSIQTAMIMAVPASVTSIGITGYLSDYYDAQLQDLINNSVELRIPLNTSIRLAKVTFNQICTLDEICSTQPFAYTGGISEPFIVGGEDREKTIQINVLLAVASVSPADNATEVALDSGISVTFSKVMSVSSITTNTADTTCSGTEQLSMDSFSTCIQMSAAPVVSNGDQTFTLTPALRLNTNSVFSLKVTTDVADAAGNQLPTEFISGFTTLNYSALGTLDTSFNSVGYTVHDSAAGGSDTDYGTTITLDASGRILVGGFSTNGAPNDDMVIWRYNADGTVDTSFNSVGYTVHDSAAGGSDADYGRAIALDSSGRILVTGSSGNGTDVDMVIWRYNADGTLDTSFNSVGYTVHANAASGNDSDEGQAITLDASGRILVGGFSTNGTGNLDMVIWRYNTDGTLDTTFASQGFVFHDSTAGGSGDEQGTAITLDASGRILVTGSSTNGTGNSDMVIWRYNVDGTLDTTFASQGFVVHDSAAGGNDTDYGTAITLDASGRILVTGYSTNGTGNSDMVIWRYNVDGTLDASFASEGFVVHDSAAGGSGYDIGYAIALDASGRILVTGHSTNGTGNNDMVIWRYNVDGTLDTSFNSVGYTVHDSAAGGSDADYGRAIALDSSGRILVTGYSTNGTSNVDMVIWRYE